MTHKEAVELFNEFENCLYGYAALQQMQKVNPKKFIYWAVYKSMIKEGIAQQNVIKMLEILNLEQVD